MAVPIQIETLYMGLVDRLFQHLPQPMPSRERLRQCKIISHRGEHIPGESQENTLAAFDKAARAGVWGIEMDVRWTQDRVPVVAHDADLQRLHGDPRRIDQTTSSVLQSGFPAIPTLEEVISRYGRRLHLMIELKQEAQTEMPRQGDILAEVLRPLQPQADYHLMALAPQILDDLPQIAPHAKLPIAYYLPDRLSRMVVRHHGWAGLCGHYLLMRRAIVARHKAIGQHVGTGFADSANTLLRELNRGIDWIFSNNAGQLQAFINRRINKGRNEADATDKTAKIPSNIDRP